MSSRRLKFAKTFFSTKSDLDLKYPQDICNAVWIFAYFSSSMSSSMYPKAMYVAGSSILGKLICASKFYQTKSWGFDKPDCLSTTAGCIAVPKQYCYTWHDYDFFLSVSNDMWGHSRINAKRFYMLNFLFDINTLIY